MTQRPRRDLRALGVAIVVFQSGCALHTPERAALRFIHDLGNGIARSEGSPAFERSRVDLHLTERPPRRRNDRVYSRSATWRRRNERIGLFSSNVLQDPPDRFDLRLSWTPTRPLRTGLLEKLLGPPYGTSATGDNGWVIQGGILEYRINETDTPYLLFSSPGYIRDPLDFLEAANLPHLPSLASVIGYLAGNAREGSSRGVDEAGFQSRTFEIANRVSVTVYSGFRPQSVPYLAGLTISLARGDGTPANTTDFLPLLRDLGIPTPEQLVAAVSGAGLPLGLTSDDTGTDLFAVYENFAVAVSRPLTGDALATNLVLWRRIESPRSLCEHLRPDLDRCSGKLQ